MPTRVRGSRRGVALVVSLVFAILCFSVAVGLILQLPMDLGAVSYRERDLKATYTCDAGLEESMAWISRRLGDGIEPCTVSDPVPTRSGSLGDWDWSCQIHPDPGTPPHGLTAFRVYRLVSTASRDGQAAKRIEAVVQAGQSFARFSMFTDLDDPTLTDYAISPYTRVRGPVHKNHPIRFAVANGVYGGQSPAVTPFDGMVSTSAAGNVWEAGSDPALNGNQYGHIFKNGQGDLRFGAPPRPLPGSSSPLANAAWGGTAPASTPAGVTVNSTGGVFISGDVDAMELSVNAAGRFVLTIDQAGQVTTVEEDPVADARIVTLPGLSPLTIPQVGNGVIYATGSIRSLKGKNKGRHTVAVDFSAGEDIEISGSLTRADTTVGSEPGGIDDRLGIVAEHIYIADDSVLPRGLHTPLHIYATILATERLEVKGVGTGSPGAMAIHGGLSTGRPSIRCYYQTSPNNHLVLHGYGGLSGYGTPDIIYDPLLANAPPPEYPTTAGTELTVRAWTESMP